MGITRLFTAVNITSRTLVSIVVITLSTLLRTLLTTLFWGVCASICESLAWVGLFVLFKVIFSSAVLVLFSVWASWLSCAILKSLSDSHNWLRIIWFCCPFFRVETVAKSTGELTKSFEWGYTNELERVMTNMVITIQFRGYWKRFVAVLSAIRNFFPGSNVGHVFSFDPRLDFHLEYIVPWCHNFN